MGNDRTTKQWKAVADVYPSHLTTMFIIEMIYTGLFALIALWWAVESAAQHFVWFIWIYILFGSPWWGPIICSGIGSGLSVCKCCGPVSSIKIGMGLGLPAGIIPICFTVLGTWAS